MIFPSIYWTSPPARQHPGDTRTGAVLLIVLVVLTIFATVGLAFIFYAQSAAVSSAAFKDGTALRRADMDPEIAFSMFMQQLLFDFRDDANGVGSALRGHSLIRNMYGLNTVINPDGTVSVVANNNVPFNGTGRLHWTYGDPKLPPSVNNPVLNGADDFNLVNYTRFPQDGLVRDPERFGVRTVLTPGLDNRGNFLGGLNPPYTAADPNCMALAAVKADGSLLMPSFHRDYLGIPLGNNLGVAFNPSSPSPTYATSAYWATDKPAGKTPAPPWLKYTVLRPRQADHPTLLPGAIFPGLPLPPKFTDLSSLVPLVTKPGFAGPEAGGDVRNRPNGWGGGAGDPTNDSVWLYPGASVQTLPDGRMYVPMFAPMILDLDSKLNINVVGNIRAQNFTHASNQGWGPWEIN